MKIRYPSGVYRLQAALILAVFLLFAANALGLLDLRLMLGGDVAVNPAVLGELLSGAIPRPLVQADFIVFIGVGAVLAVLLPALTPISASLLTFACMLPPWYVAWAHPVPPALVPLEYSLLVILILFSVNVLSTYYIDTRERQKIVTAFGYYVPPPLVAAISRNPDAFSMAGQAREMSVMFCDIKRFSRLSEQLEPAVLADMLNHYLTAMTDVLHAHGATIDKYIGDAIMAFWGAPLDQPRHAQRAVDAALAMGQRLRTLEPEFIARGWPPLAIGIGIASGVMNVGNMGSRYRVAYTVLGDAVNLAARLEALTRLYGVEILVSAATREACTALRFREIDHVRVRGKGQAGRIFEPLAPGTCDDALLAREAAALAAYYAGDWPRATSAFDELDKLQPATRWYALLRERMTLYTPPADWDGVIRYGSDLGANLGGSADEQS